MNVSGMKLSTSDIPAKVEVLTARYRRMQDMRIRFEADIERYGSELSVLSQNAMDKYKTCDVDELKKIADDMEAKDILALSEFEKQLDEAARIIQKTDETTE